MPFELLACVKWMFIECPATAASCCTPADACASHLTGNLEPLHHREGIQAGGGASLLTFSICWLPQVDSIAITIVIYHPFK